MKALRKVATALVLTLGVVTPLVTITSPVMPAASPSSIYTADEPTPTPTPTATPTGGSGTDGGGGCLGAGCAG